jgi:predicted peptidase
VKIISVFFAAPLAFALALTTLGIGQNANNPVSAGPSATNKYIKNATAIGEVFGDGEKITAVIVEYDKEINNSKLFTSAFSVKDRNIIKVYANTSAAKAAKGDNGRFVVIELDPSDKEASVLSGDLGRRAGPGGPPGQGDRGGQGRQGDRGGPGGGIMIGGGGGQRKPVKATVAQIDEITPVKGDKIPADPNPFETNRAVNLVVDDFLQLDFKDPASGVTLMYNLYVPRHYDKTKSYPMVLFMHDASVNNPEHDRTLIQGLGAVIWASPEEQAKHPAFVLATQNNNTGSMSSNPDMLDVLYRLVNYVANQYNIDKNRLYTTGQSAGCMTSLAINIKYPDLFAASMLVAGQWDAQATSVLKDKKMWIVVSEGDFRAFPGMNASIEVWEKEGAKVTRGRWSAREPQDVQAANVAKMAAEHNNVMYTTFIKGTTLPPELENSGSQEHMTSWRFAYAIPSIRDWLFAQRKAPRQQLPKVPQSLL